MAVRVDRAASEINPFLIVAAIGLFVLNITLYIGLSIAHDPTIWPGARQNMVAAPAAGVHTEVTDGLTPGTGN